MIFIVTWYKLVWCLRISAFDFGNSIPFQLDRNEASVVKIRISKSEIRNNIKMRMFKIQNKNGLALLLLVLIIDIFVIRICFEFRYSNFGFPRP